MYTFVYMGKSVIGINTFPHHIFSLSLFFFFLTFERKNFSQHLEFSNLAILESSRILTSLTPKCWNGRHVLPCLLLHECRDMNSGPNSCIAGTLITELVAWPTGLVLWSFFVVFILLVFLLFLFQFLFLFCCCSCSVEDFFPQIAYT